MHRIRHSERDWNRWNYNSKLGSVLLLAQVEIDWPMLEAALNHWDPVDKVFRFGLHELCPTLEEYSQFLKIPERLNEGIIVPRIKTGYANDIAEFLMIDRDELPKGAVPSCSRKLLWEKASHNRYDQYEDERCVRAFTAIVAAEVLFPRTYEEVDGVVFNILLQMKMKRSLASVLIAETIRSLSHCVHVRKGTFKGCPALLQAWLREHIPGLCILSDTTLKGKSPAEDHANRKPRPSLNHVEAYEDYFKFLKTEHIIWSSKWFVTDRPRLNLPKLHYMVLFGIGCSVVYAPFRVLRQFRRMQQIPIITRPYEHMERITTSLPKEAYQRFHKLWNDCINRDITLEITEEASVEAGYIEWMKTQGEEAHRRRIMSKPKEVPKKKNLYTEKPAKLLAIIEEKDALITQLKQRLEIVLAEQKGRGQIKQAHQATLGVIDV